MAVEVIQTRPRADLSTAAANLEEGVEVISTAARKRFRRPWLAFLVGVVLVVFLFSASTPLANYLKAAPAIRSISTAHVPTPAGIAAIAASPGVISIARRLDPQSAPPPPTPSPLLSPPPSPSPTVAGVTDAKCHVHLHADYMGERAPVWGLGNPGFHLRDAAECCAACQAHGAICGKPGSESSQWWPSRPELRCGRNPGCNIWVFCPEEQCFAFDIHTHIKGECWHKQQVR